MRGNTDSVISYSDGMLLRKAIAIRDGIKAGSINPLWAEFMLQQVVDKNNSCDLQLRPVFAKLKRPTLAQIGLWLEERPFNYDQPTFHASGIAKELEEMLYGMHWTEGPDELELVTATMENLFIYDWNIQESQGVVVENAVKAGLVLCPDWVVPALAMHAEKSAPKKGRVSINICLEHDQARRRGCALSYERSWHLYARTADPRVPWSSQMNWLFAKGR